MNEQAREKQLERLMEARKRADEHMAAQQQRVNQRFDALERRIIAPDGKRIDTQQRIISAALELLDEEGLNELSLRKLASKVDLKAPALYWYFKNKEELIDYMAEAILASEFAELVPRTDSESWQDWLVTMCQRLRAAMLSRRDGARIVAGAHLFPAVTLAQLMEIASESLSSAAVLESEIDLVVGTAIHYTFGRVIEEQSSPSLDEVTTMDFKDIANTYPRLGRMIERIQESGSFVGFSDDNFEQSLRLIIR